MSPFNFHEPSSGSRSHQSSNIQPHRQPQTSHGSVSPSISHRFRSPPPSSSINTFREFSISQPDSPQSTSSLSSSPQNHHHSNSRENTERTSSPRLLFPEHGLDTLPPKYTSASPPNILGNNLNENQSPRPRNYFQNVRVQSMTHPITVAPSFPSSVSPSLSSRQPKQALTVTTVDFDDDRSPPDVDQSPRLTSRAPPERPRPPNNREVLTSSSRSPVRPTRLPVRPVVVVTESLRPEDEDTRPWNARPSSRAPPEVRQPNHDDEEDRSSQPALDEAVIRSREQKRPYLPPPDAASETPFGDVVDTDRVDDEPGRHRHVDDDDGHSARLEERPQSQERPRTRTRQSRPRTTTTTEEPETRAPLLEDPGHRLEDDIPELPRSPSSRPPIPRRPDLPPPSVEEPPSTRKPKPRRVRVKRPPPPAVTQPVDSFSDDGEPSRDRSSSGRSLPSSSSSTTAEKCDPKVCKLPNCRCGGTSIPGGLKPKQVPQIVMITFDDAINDLNWDIYEEIFHSGRKNPNGCPPLGTFYVSHEWTDYSQVQTLYSYGHEMASHGVTHSFGEKFSIKQWTKEVQGQREILHLYGGVRMEDVRGMRAPFLQV